MHKHSMDEYVLSAHSSLAKANEAGMKQHYTVDCFIKRLAINKPNEPEVVYAIQAIQASK